MKMTIRNKYRHTKTTITSLKSLNKSRAILSIFDRQTNLIKASILLGVLL